MNEKLMYWESPFKTDDGISYYKSLKDEKYNPIYLEDNNYNFNEIKFWV